MLTPKKLADLFQTSSAALLLALASALFLIISTSPDDLIPPHDPILGLSVRTLYWIVGGMALAIALDCLFGNHSFRPMLLLAWLATNFLAYRLGLISVGSHGLTGLLGGFSYAFGMPAKVANVLAQAVWGYLLVGSCGTIWWLGWQRKQDQNLLKMPCPICGVHIKFASQNVGRKIPCPYCQDAITLRKPDLMKMACFFCKEHIEFPTHAIGQKILCPHCKMDITLKESA